MCTSSYRDGLWEVDVVGQSAEDVGQVLRDGVGGALHEGRQPQHGPVHPVDLGGGPRPLACALQTLPETLQELALQEGKETAGRKFGL